MVAFLGIASLIIMGFLFLILYSIVRENIRISKEAHNLKENQAYELREVSKNPFEPDKVQICTVECIVGDYCKIIIKNDRFVVHHEEKSMLKSEFVALGWKPVLNDGVYDN